VEPQKGGVSIEKGGKRLKLKPILVPKRKNWKNPRGLRREPAEVKKFLKALTILQQFKVEVAKTEEA